MIDVLSINKKYLLKYNVIDTSLVNELTFNTVEVKDANIADYAKVEHNVLINSLSVDAHNLVKKL